MRLEFFEACVPPKTTHHAKRRVSFIRDGVHVSALADDPKLTAARDTWAALFVGHKPRVPFAGPVELRLVFYFPMPSSWSDKKRRQMHLTPHTTKPDCSNMAKTVEDVLAELRFMENDKLVTDLSVRKLWSLDPGVFVSVADAMDIDL